jgi:hypothetical protein
MPVPPRITALGATLVLERDPARPCHSPESTQSDCTSGTSLAPNLIFLETDMCSDLRAGERDRTADLPFTRRLLCLLSYTGGRLVHGSRPHPDVLNLLLTRTFASTSRRCP